MTEPGEAKLKRKSEFVGEGCIWQGIGLLAPVVGYYLLGITGVVFGGIVLLALLVVGSNKSTKWVCGNCRNPVVDKGVRMCPVCKANLSP